MARTTPLAAWARLKGMIPGLPVLILVLGLSATAAGGWVIERLAAGDRTIAQMVPVLYAAVDSRLWPAASLSVQAHLIKLVREGRVVAEPAPTLGAAYRMA